MRIRLFSLYEPDWFTLTGRLAKATRVENAMNVVRSGHKRPCRYKDHKNVTGRGGKTANYKMNKAKTELGVLRSSGARTPKA